MLTDQSSAVSDEPLRPRPAMPSDGEAEGMSSTDRPAAAAEVTTNSSESSRGKDVPDMPSAAKERIADIRVREAGRREAQTDGKIVIEQEPPHSLSTTYLLQRDWSDLPVLAGDEADGMQLCENMYSADERGVPTVHSEVVPADEKSPMMANGCSQRRDGQELLSSTREDFVDPSLRGSEDCDEGLEARASSKDGETASEKDELHTSPSGCHQKTGEVELSPRVGDQAAIAHVHETGPSAEVLKEAVSTDEELQVLSCRCSEPIREEELNEGNVITCLLGNEYNCSVERAQERFEWDDNSTAEQWERAAKKANVELEQPRVGIVYADEKAMDDLEVEVPRQMKYVGTRPALSPSLADTPCADLGVDGMLQVLNHLLRTTYTLDRPELSSVLQSYVDRGFDFGLAYGHIRLWWFMDFTKLQEWMRLLETKDKKRRDKTIDGAYIVDRDLPPRRAWDLYSNRVLPWWILLKWNPDVQLWTRMQNVDAVSHSWVHPDDRQSVWTPINGRKWPVPIPKDVTLDRIRVELLNVGREFVWLDVLCLWQEGVPEDDAARLHEWELDVPTIGGVYQSFYPNTVVTYFNGLGRPFRVGNLDDKRHWLNRAWTLQEFRNNGIIGGLVPGSFPPPMVNNQVNSDLNVVRFYRRLHAASNNNFENWNVVFPVLAAMSPRHAAHVVDQVGGITHILATSRIPKYIRGSESSAAENAWDLLLPVMDNYNLAYLFFLYPARGAGKYAWCPSWEQVKDPLPPAPFIILRGSLDYKNDDRFECQGWLLEKCQIQGFANPDARRRCRTGTLRVVHDGAQHSFTVAAHHQVPIPDGSYALIGDGAWASDNVVVWAVGTFNSDRRLEKLSVLTTEDGGDIERLQDLGLIGKYYDISLKSSIALV